MGLGSCTERGTPVLRAQGAQGEGHGAAKGNLGSFHTLLARDAQCRQALHSVQDDTGQRVYSLLVLLPGKSHGRSSLVGCSPWGHKESDTTEQLHFHFSLSCIGEGNGNPLECSCLKNPRDGGSLVGCRLWGRTEADTTEVT